MVKISNSLEPIDDKPLRPGEIKILKALQTGPRNFTAIKKTTGLQQNVLSQYLKRLQRIKIITKDFVGRQYQLSKISEEILFYNDIAEFFNQKIKTFTNLGKENAQVAYLSLWTAFTEYPKMKEYMENLTMKPKFSRSLSGIPVIIERFWKPYILSTEYTQRDQKIIQTYERLLLEYTKTFKAPEERESQQALYNMLLEMTKYELRRRFPNCDVSERMVLIETARKYKKITKIEESLDNALFQPRNLEEVQTLLDTMKRTGQFRDSLTEQECARIAEIYAFLKKRSNKILFDGFSNKVRNYPRKLILFYVSGFYGYDKQINKINAVVKKTEEQERKRILSRRKTI